MNRWGPLAVIAVILGLAMLFNMPWGLAAFLFLISLIIFW